MVDRDITILAALTAGLLSFLSPCVLPLVPAYVAYLAGASLRELPNVTPNSGVRFATIPAAALFVAGLSTVFVALGAGASAIGTALRSHLDALEIVAGTIIIIMGLQIGGLIRIDLLMRQARAEVGKPATLAGAYVMGLAFGFGWTPCVGPILAAILAIAASEATLAKGATLLAVYALGLGLPFIVAAFLAEPFRAFVARFRAHFVLIERATGALLVITGIIFVASAMAGLTYSQAMEWLVSSAAST
jgi:cytochrome c-type biogenesis protein